MHRPFELERKWATRLVLVIVFATMAATASPVIAVPPIVNTLDFVFSGTIAASEGLCPFDVDITAVGLGTERIFTDQDGNLTRISYNFVEQDTFSAHGHELVGEPFNNIQQVLFDDDGNVTHAYEVGIIERVPLPDGTVFLSAGRLDFVIHDFSFRFVPDVGHSGDVEAFCAALAP